MLFKKNNFFFLCAMRRGDSILRTGPTKSRKVHFSPRTDVSNKISSHFPDESIHRSIPKTRSPMALAIAGGHFAAPPTLKTLVFSKNHATTSASIAPSQPSTWSLDSWKLKRALQIPKYPNGEELESVLRTLSSFPPLVFAGEARRLEERLAEAAVGRAFVLQGGDCAESFKDFTANNIRDTLRVFLQMGVVLAFGGQMPIVKVCFDCEILIF